MTATETVTDATHTSHVGGGSFRAATQRDWMVRWTTGCRRKVVACATANSSLALFDQGIVSATRFVTTVLIGRMCGPVGLGMYAVLFAIILFVSCVQQTLISRPYTIYGQRKSRGGRRRYAGSVLVHHVLLAAAAWLLTSLAGVTAYVFRLGSPDLRAIIFALSAVIPGLLVWEFARRIAFAHLKMHQAILIDMAAAVLQLSGLLLLARADMLTLPRALGVMACGCGAAGLAWLWVSRRQFSVRLALVRRDWSQNWSFGKWVFACQLTGNLHGYTVPWIITFLIGAGATGIFSACETIVLLANPLLLGLANWLGPHTAHAYAVGGAAKVRQITRNAMFALLLAMGLFSLGLFVFGEPLLSLFFGAQYSGHGHIVALIGLCTLAWVVSLAIVSGLSALEQSRATFISSALGLIVTVALSVPLLATLGLVGAAIALLAGSVSVTAYAAVALFAGSNAQSAREAA